jgi:hypothetical protein
MCLPGCCEGLCGSVWRVLWEGVGWGGGGGFVCLPSSPWLPAPGCVSGFLKHSFGFPRCTHWARIFKRSWSPGINFKEWIPPAYVAWRAGTITLFLLGPSPHRVTDSLKIPALGWYSETGFHIGMDRNYYSVYGADTIAETKLFISPFLRWSLDLLTQLLGF